ncbi:MAG: type IX secretion system membrane protein PorP/SprF [Draconibacterium sp.]
MNFGKVYYGLIANFLFFLLVTLQSAAQQDPIFTQYMFNGQIHNPAYAGMWEKIGFTALVREQWAGINRAPLTEAISFHTPLSNAAVGLGLNIINDTYGREKRLSVLADYAYEVYLTPQRRLRFGIKFGFVNYKNPLTEYELYPDGEFDRAFAEDIDLSFLPNFGIGAFLYEDNYYVGLSIPKLVENDFKDNFHNYSTKAEVRTVYLNGGYVFQFLTGNKLVFKPTAMVRASWGAPVQYDLAANFLIMEKLWVGAMNRSNNAICVTAQWMFNNNMRVGFAMDVTYNEIFPYQNGTYEFTIGYDVDFFGRSYMRAKYF